MKIQAQVISDSEGKRKDGTPYRQLILVDEDPEFQLTETFRLNIDVNDKVAGPGTNIRGSVVTAAVTRIVQYESGSLAFGGHLLAIDGSKVFKALPKAA